MSVLEDVWQAIVAAVVWLGLGSADPAAFQGYVEAEYVRVGLPAAGTLKRLEVARGDRVVAGQALFSLDDTAERAARDESAGQVQRAAAHLADLRKGKRPEEQDVVHAQRRQAEASLRLSEVELQRAERLHAANVVAKSRLVEPRPNPRCARPSGGSPSVRPRPRPMRSSPTRSTARASSSPPARRWSRSCRLATSRSASSCPSRSSPRSWSARRSWPNATAAPRRPRRP
jgi:pyruvate/2-oxoglutarate dehydrogenase complex dihydrolipoamide acyltransferase (E2) component